MFLQQNCVFGESNWYNSFTRGEFVLEELVEKAKCNDDEAFAEAMFLVKKDLYLIAKSNLKNEDDVMDCIQETTISAYRNLKKLKDNRFFKTWVIRILINKCNKIYKQRYRKCVSYDEKEMENYLVSDSDLDDNISFDFLIRNLKRDEKNILTLYYCSNFTTKEISKLLKMKESTVRSKIMRAKEKLRKIYKLENRSKEGE